MCRFPTRVLVSSSPNFGLLAQQLDETVPRRVWLARGHDSLLTRLQLCSRLTACETNQIKATCCLAMLSSTHSYIYSTALNRDHKPEAKNKNLKGFLKEVVEFIIS